MKILICGDRHWQFKGPIYRILNNLASNPSDITVIHGGCRGADAMAGEIAEGFGMKVEVYPAEWEKHGKAAGPIRNQNMLEQKPDMVIAFHNDIQNSKGTKDMITRAKKAGIDVYVISSPAKEWP